MRYCYLITFLYAFSFISAQDIIEEICQVSPNDDYISGVAIDGNSIAWANYSGIYVDKGFGPRLVSGIRFYYNNL